MNTQVVKDDAGAEPVNGSLHLDHRQQVRLHEGDG